MNLTQERILGFDLTRVVAIFVVIGIYHNLAYAGVGLSEAPVVLSLVYSSLGAFTFLSAYLLSSKYKFANKKEITTFYKKRILRIWPLFAISSIMLWLIHFNQLIPTLKGIVGISPFWAPAPITMWYVAMLITLYLMTPFVVKGTVKMQLLKAVLVMAVVGAIQLIFNSVVPKTFNYYTVYLIGLIVGANYYEKTMFFLSSKKTLLISSLWMILFVIVFVTANAVLKSLTGVLGIIAVMNLSILITNKIRKHSFLEKTITILAYSSFCAYLFHREVIWALLHFKLFEGGWPVFFEVLFIGVPLTFIISYLIQRLYDYVLQRINN